MGSLAAARTLSFLLLVLLVVQLAAAGRPPPAPRRILVDTDVDTDDLFAILYLLKQDRSEFDLEVPYHCHFLVLSILPSWLAFLGVGIV
jgi:hypothetical protein